MTDMKYETRDGDPVTIFMTNYRVRSCGHTTYRIVGIVHGSERDSFCIWYPNGMAYGGVQTSPLDLFIVSDVTRYVVLNADAPDRESIWDSHPYNVGFDPHKGDVLHEIKIKSRRPYAEVS